MVSKPLKAVKAIWEGNEESFLLDIQYNFLLIRLPLWEVSAFLSVALSRTQPQNCKNEDD